MKASIISVVLILLISISFYNCEKDYPVCPTLSLLDANLPDEETAILMTILKEYHSQNYVHTIQQTYLDYDSAANANYIFKIIKDSFYTVDTILVAEYAHNNLSKKNIPSNELIHPIHEDEITCMFSIGCEEGWKAYYKKYPKSSAFIEFSRPGILGNQAIIDYAIYFGCQGAFGYFVILIKENGVWKIDKRKTTWIS